MSQPSDPNRAAPPDDFLDQWWASLPHDQRWLVNLTIQRLRRVRSVEDAVRVATQFKQMDQLCGQPHATNKGNREMLVS